MQTSRSVRTSRKSNQSSRIARHDLVISESKLRKLIREELARDLLIQEGFTDALKSPFKKLGEKAKKFVIEKAEEILAKIQSSVKSIGKGSADQYKQFFSSMEKEEGGMSFDELVASTPEYAKLQEESKTLLGVEAEDIMPAGGASTKKESFDLAQLRTSLILLEEKYLQRQESTSRSLLRESVIATVAGAWWASVKTVVATCGLLGWAAGALSTLCKKLGFESAAKFFEKADHFLHHVEEFFLSKVAFPLPVQYAAYRAMAAGKGMIDKARGKKGSDHEVLDFAKFKSPEGKEERAATIKAIHTAVVAVLVIDAIVHLFHSMATFLKAVTKTASELTHAAAHTGVEASNLAKVGRGASVAAGEAFGGTKSLSSSH